MGDRTVGTLGEAGEGWVIGAAAARSMNVPDGAIGIGDDAARVPIAGGAVITTVDLLVEGVHFRRETILAPDLGWKSLAVNLSDVAAMGGEPKAVLVALALPKDLEMGFVTGFYAGLAELAAQHGVWIAGGDTTGSTGPIVVSITAMGEPGPRTLTRDAARAGDVLFVTGTPGRSAAGLLMLERPPSAPVDPALAALALTAHRRPVPQVAAGRALARLDVRLALLDDSDGLGRSAQLLASMGGVDVTIDAAALQDPVVAAIAPDPLALALHGGEDYHLVGTCAAGDWPAVAAALAAAGFPGRVVGSVTPGPGRALVQPASGPPDVLVGEAGYAHFAQTSFPPR